MGLFQQYIRYAKPSMASIEKKGCCRRKITAPIFSSASITGFNSGICNYFLRPQLEALGAGCTFMKPWYVEIFGGPIAIGDHTHVIATPDKRVRLTVWSTLEGGGRIEIGSYCLVCPGVRMSAGMEIVIGDSVMLAQGAFITDSDWHGVYDRSLSVGQSAPVSIGRNAWIGDSAIVAKGVTIGENSIIGAGAVVIRDIPPNVIAVGNPATVVQGARSRTAHQNARTTGWPIRRYWPPVCRDRQKR